MWSILSIGHKDSAWVEEALLHYNKLLKPPFKINYINCQTCQGNKSEQENQLLLKNLPKNNYLIGLDSQGILLSSKAFANKINHTNLHNSKVCFIIGGAFGLNHKLKSACNELWSLSTLTFPHKIVKIILAEQLYRADCILTNHPYHK